MTFPAAGAQSFVDVLRLRVDRTPEALAYRFLEDGEKKTADLDYAALDRKARALGALLADRGARGERVLLPLPQGLSFLEAFWGCLYAGALAVPLAPLSLSQSQRSLPRLRSVLRDAQARFVLVPGRLLGATRELFQQNGLSSLEPLAADGVDEGWADAWRHPEVDTTSIAFLQYTSGSTSDPKGVMVGHGNLLHNSEILRIGLRNHDRAVVVTWLPSFHDMGLIGNHLQAVYAGVPCVFLTPLHFLQRPRRWLEAISRHGGTTSGGPNFAYELCAARVGADQLEGLDLRSWTTAFNGAEPVRTDTLRRFSRAFVPYGFAAGSFYPCYGLAEGTLIVSGRHDGDGLRFRAAGGALRQGRAEEAAAGEDDAISLVSCGRSGLEQRIAIVDPETRAELPERRVGEIWVSGGSVAQGYWNRPAESDEIFRARVAGGDDRGWLRTGDLGFLAAGDLFVTGRLKDVIIIRGQNHYPHDIEWTVQGSHPALNPGGAAAFALDEEGEERLAVVQEVKRGPAPDLDEVVEAVRRRVAETHQLELSSLTLVSAGTVPKTTSGKVQRRACRASLLDGTLPALASWKLPPEPRAEARKAADGIEAWLVERLARRTGTDPVAIDPEATFANHGVDSAAAVALAAELGEWLGRALPATLFYDHPSPAAVARFLEGAAAPAAVAAPAETAEPIAIVGIGCRFPGARGPRELWRLLSGGVDAISEVPGSRWDLGRLYDADPSAPGKMSTRWGGFLDAVDELDAPHFGISPREAGSMDPQQRLLLEVSWEALEDAGIVPESLRGSPAGVFVGVSNADYGRLLLGATERLDAYAGTGNSASIAANRLSFFYDLRGPSLAVDTACSSALVAVHLACRSLAAGECSVALAGGVNVIVDPAPTVVFSKAGLLAPDGRCKVFDARADGYVRSEGCGLVVLKPLSRALADGDPVYAVIRGSAVNQDGRSNGLTAPSRQAQEGVVRDACRRAGVLPGEVQYVELHGTGTELGDPIEAMALGTVMAEGRAAGGRCAVGSIKSNLGHLEAAAGIAGLIKVALSISHGELPASLHFRTPNPKIPFAELPLAVQAETSPWPGEDTRLAGVSSFGFGGTNAHVVLAAPAVPPAREPEGEGWEILPLSARTEEILDRAAAGLAAALAVDPGAGGPRLPDAAWTLQTGRARLAFRRAVVVRGRQDAAAVLAGSEPERVLGLKAPRRARGVAFLLPGLGDHYPGMAAGLYRAEPVFRAEIDRCLDLLRPLGLDLADALLSPPAQGEEEGGLRSLLRRGGEPDAGPLADTALAQPAVFAVDWAVARLLASWGIEPTALLGYSLGEYVAAALAGVFSLDDALILVARRARLIAALPAGAMLAVPLPEVEALALAQGALSLAAVNGPASSVLAGSPAAVAELEREFAGRGIATMRLATSHAFHSRALEPLRGELTALVEAVERQAPRIPYLSNVTGAWITEEQARSPAYWADHMTGTVRFADGLARLLGEPGQVLVEVGPGQTLGSFAQQHPGFTGEPGASVLASLPARHARQSHEAYVRGCLARLWLQGIEPDWAALAGGRSRRRVALPTYPFERNRYWLTPPAAAATPAPATDGKHPDAAEWYYRPVWRQAPLSGQEVVPVEGTWWIAGNPHGLGEALRRELAASGMTAELAEESGPPAALPARLGRVVHLGLVGGAVGEGTETPIYEEAAAWVRALAAREGGEGEGSVELVVVASGLFRVEGNERLEPEKAVVLGPCGVAPQEHPQIACRVIDLSAAELAEEGLARPLLSELAGPAPTPSRVALRGGRRFVEEHEAVRLEGPAPGAGLRPGGTYLITGGMGGVGLAMATGLARAARARLALVGRSPFPEPGKRQAWLDRHGSDDPTSRRILRLRELEALGAEVLVLQADAADPEALGRAARQAVERFGTLHGAVHAAGSVDPAHFGSLAAGGEAGVEAHFAAKVRGARAFAQALDGLELDFRLLTSSISTVLGGLGFGAYAAANAFLEAFAESRTDGRWLAVAWDGWRVGDRQAGGMGASVARYAMTGEEGADAFLRLVVSPLSGRVVQSTGDLSARRALWSRPVPATPGTQLAAARSEADAVSLPAGNDLERRIAALWCRALGVRAVGLHDNFFDLGGNSLIGVQLVAELNRELGAALSNVALFESPTVAALARAVAGRRAGEAPRSASALPLSAGASEPVAIVGMAGRFPGADGIDELWAALRDARETISFFSAEELIEAGVDPALVGSPDYVRARPILSDVETFDAELFGFSPREAALMDPQHRLFLECCWTALEHAGYDSRRFPGAISLYAGCSLSSYLLSLYADPDVAPTLDPYQMVVGNDKDSMPTTVSYKLDLKGPSVAVQTHCSTSLVATHLAVRALRAGECDLALAGGVSVRVPQKFGYRYHEGGQDSPDGHCRAFDAEARGTVFGDGVGAVVLKRLGDALADGDTVYAVIRGSAVNNDGSGKIGYTAPSVEGQALAVERALADAGVDPSTISYVEAHGSGTRLGDPIEVAALSRAYRASTDRQGFCGLGSVKTNLGHLDRASGVTGLIKTTLALRHRTLPATLHFQAPNPELDLASSPFFVAAETQAWEGSGGPLRAAVNSLGMGGTNAHVVLEEAPPPAPPVPPRRPEQLLVLSARTATALETATANLAAWLEGRPEDDTAGLADAAFTLALGRRPLAHRRVVTAAGPRAAAAALRALDARRVATGTGSASQRPVAFLLPGVGDHLVGMGGELYRLEPGFRERVDESCEILAPHLGLDLRPLLFPTAGEGSGNGLRRLLGRGEERPRGPLDRTAVAQPAVFVLSHALAGLLSDWGIRPSALLGYSLGEYVAACLAGVFSLEDALAVVAGRARLLEAMPGGAMLAVPLPEPEVAPLLSDGLSLAAVNGPRLSVLAGPEEAVAAAERALAGEGVAARRLAVSHPFHSAALAPARPEIAALFRSVRLAAPRVPLVSNLTGRWMTAAEATDPGYWVEHTCRTVRFADGLRELAGIADLAAVEVGPGQALTSALLQGWPAEVGPLPPAAPTLGHRIDGEGEAAFLLASLGRLWVSGCEVDWQALYGGEARRRVPLPTYPFERRRHWIDARRLPTAAGERQVSAPRPVTPAGKSGGVESWLYAPAWRRSPAEPDASALSGKRWLVFDDGAGLGEAFARRLEELGGAVVLARQGGSYGRSSDGAFELPPGDAEACRRLFAEAGGVFDGIAHLWSAALAPEVPAERALESGFYGLLALAQALPMPAADRRLRLLAASANACDVVGGDLLAPAQATIAGPVLSIPREMPGVECRWVDLDLRRREPAAVEEAAAFLASEAALEWQETRAALRSGHRWVESFEPIRLPAPGRKPARLRERGVYLITGGLGGLGLALAEHLAEKLQARLILLGRSAPTAEKRQRIAHLEAAGAEVLALAADVTDQEALEAALALARERFGPIHGAFHAAGVPGEGLIQRKERERAAAVLAPKVQGTLSLAEALAGDPLDFLFLFSSSSSVTGGLGEVDYCAANAFLDAWAGAAGRSLFTVSVNWGPWQWDAWQESLLGAAPALLERVRELRAEIGLTFAEGMDALERALAGSYRQVAVLTRPPAALAALVAGLAAGPSAAPVRRAATMAGVSPGPRLARPDLKNPYVPPLGSTEEQVAAAWSEALGFAEVGRHDSFFELGGHSLLATQIFTRLRAELGVELPLASLFDGPTVAELAGRIAALAGEAASRPRASGMTEGPLTHAQRRLWFLARLEPEDPTHNESMGMRVTGALAPAALVAAFAALAGRHEVLRTALVAEGGEPIQRVLPAGSVSLAMPVADLSALPPVPAARELERLAVGHARRPFDLARPPLARALLVHTGGEEWQILFAVHHAVHDGRSGFILESELAALYQAAVEGRPAQLARPSLRYLDYARFERETLSGRALEERVEAGVRRLEGAPTVLSWRSDRPRPEAASRRAGRQPVAVPEEAAHALRGVARDHQASLYMASLAGFGALLHVYTGGDDLLVASPAANRTVPGSEDVLGLFANLLVMRLDLRGDPSFAEILRRVRGEVLDALALSDLPFEALVERLRPERDPSHPLLVQAHFSHESEPLPVWRGAGIEMVPAPFDHGTTPYELDLNLVEQAGGALAGELIYAADLFDAATVTRAAGRYEALLGWVAADPGLRLSALVRRFEEEAGAERRQAARSLGGASLESLRRLPRRPAQPRSEPAPLEESLVP